MSFKWVIKQKDHLLVSVPNLVVALKRRHTHLDPIPVELQVVLTPGRWPVSKQFESDKPAITLITEHCGANALASWNQVAVTRQELLAPPTRLTQHQNPWNSQWPTVQFTVCVCIYPLPRCSLWKALTYSVTNLSAILMDVVSETKAMETQTVSKLGRWFLYTHTWYHNC